MTIKNVDDKIMRIFCILTFLVVIKIIHKMLHETFVLFEEIVTVIVAIIEWLVHKEQCCFERECKEVFVNLHSLLLQCDTCTTCTQLVFSYKCSSDCHLQIPSQSVFSLSMTNDVSVHLKKLAFWQSVSLYL